MHFSRFLYISQFSFILLILTCYLFAYFSSVSYSLYLPLTPFVFTPGGAVKKGQNRKIQ